MGYDEECDFDTVLTHPQDVAVAAFARFVQGPLNLLASIAFLDGSWIEFPAVFGFGDFGAAAEAATDLSSSAVGVASTAVTAATATAATDTYVVSNGLADLESLRDELFSSSAHAAQHFASSSAAGAAAAVTCGGGGGGGSCDACDAVNTLGNAMATCDSASSAAHVFGGLMFFISSVAWIIELRAEQRLKCSVGGGIRSVPEGLKAFTPESDSGEPAVFKVTLIGSEVGRKGRTRSLVERLTTYGRGLMMSQWNQMSHWK